jgi:hypothetical protein
MVKHNNSVWNATRRRIQASHNSNIAPRVGGTLIMTFIKSVARIAEQGPDLLNLGRWVYM